MRQHHIVIERLMHIFDYMPEDIFLEVVKSICSASHIATYGVGREGLVMQALAMRLYHLGINVSVVGEMVCQPIQRDELLLVSIGPGRLSTCEAITNKALSAGASVTIFTATPDFIKQWTSTVKIVSIPAKTMAEYGSSYREGYSLPLGSEYELSLWLYFDMITQSVQRDLLIDSTQMIKRHTNLE